MKTLVTLFTIMVTAFTNIANAELTRKGFYIGLEYSLQDFTVDSIPLSVRDVPVHPNDLSSIGGQGPIDRQAYDAEHGAGLDIGAFWEWETSHLSYGLSLGLKWVPYPAGDAADTQLRNYQGAPGTERRGYGTALTFLSVGRYGVIPSTDPTADLFLAWTPTVRFELGPSQGSWSQLKFGVEATYWEYRVVTGWDRYDDLDQRDVETLSRHIPIRTYIKWQPDDSFVLRAGAQIQAIQMNTSLGDESGADAPDVTVFVSAGYGF